jgi:hypothetical protein
MGKLRTRSEGPLSTSATTEKYYINTSGTKTMIDSKDLTVFSYYKAITDTVTPNYRQRIAAGEIINNPMNLIVEELDADTGGYYHATVDANGVVYENRNGSTTLYEDSLPVYSSEEPDMPSVDVNHMIAEAKAYAISNINPSDYKFGEDLFELGETLRFLRNPIVSIRKLSREFVRDTRKLEKKYKRAADIADAASDVYLSYQFGVQPLLRSSLDAIENLNRNRAKERPKRLTARGFSNDGDSVSGTYRKYFNPNAYDTYSFMKSKQVSVKASILYDVLLPTNDLQMNLGLRPSDIPETLWAVVPLSFMVDRIWDISTAIRGVTNLSQPHLRILAASVTVKDEEKSTLQFTDQKNSGVTVSVQGDVVRRKRFTYDRSVWHPTVDDTIPPSDLLNVVSNAQYISDLTALTVKALRPVVQKFGFNQPISRR